METAKPAHSNSGVILVNVEIFTKNASAERSGCAAEPVADNHTASYTIFINCPAESFF
jgi:hypothetical protein